MPTVTVENPPKDLEKLAIYGIVGFAAYKFLLPKLRGGSNAPMISANATYPLASSNNPTYLDMAAQAQQQAAVQAVQASGAAQAAAVSAANSAAQAGSYAAQAYQQFQAAQQQAQAAQQAAADGKLSASQAATYASQAQAAAQQVISYYNQALALKNQSVVYAGGGTPSQTHGKVPATWNNPTPGGGWGGLSGGQVNAAYTAAYGSGAQAHWEADHAAQVAQNGF